MFLDHRAPRRRAAFALSSLACMASLAGHAAGQAAYLGIGSGIDGVGDLYGSSVAQLHDVNGDGINELLIGAPGNDDAGLNAGAVFVINGLYATVIYQVKGKPGDELGWSVANVGDVDGDGIDDFAAGRPGRSVAFAEAGAGSVYSGTDGHLLWTQDGTKAGARSGTVVAGAGDVDGDGFGDVLVGAPGYDGPNALTDANWGRAVLYSGDNGLPLKTFVGAAKDDRLGEALAGVKDMNGDGRADFAIGIPGRETGGPPLFIVNGGTCEVYSGKTLGLMFSVDGIGGDEACGSSVAPIGDTDHDGLQEIAVGGPGWGDARGRVTVREGKTGALLHVLEGPHLTNADRYGSAVAGAGDVNHDGFVDLLIGAPATGTGSGGWSHVISGKDFTQYDSAFGSYPDWGFGTQIAAGLDTSDDGWPDALYGMPHSTNQGTDSGFVWSFQFVHYQPNIGLQGPGSASMVMYGTELYSGGVADLRIAYAPAPFTPVYLIVSPFEATVPFKGGVLVPQLGNALIFPLLSDAKSRVTLTGLPGGNGYQLVFLQALIPYAGAPQGWWLTNTVVAELLP
ncbi:MAG TPA: integrin alpha [Planctomycetota bacterium]|nr:integrin alpha [Planctomycetota bacterium]